MAKRELIHWCIILPKSALTWVLNAIRSFCCTDKDKRPLPQPTSQSLLIPSALCCFFLFHLEEQLLYARQGNKPFELASRSSLHRNAGWRLTKSFGMRIFGIVFDAYNQGFNQMVMILSWHNLLLYINVQRASSQQCIITSMRFVTFTNVVAPANRWIVKLGSCRYIHSEWKKSEWKLIVLHCYSIF